MSETEMAAAVSVISKLHKKLDDDDLDKQKPCKILADKQLSICADLRKKVLFDSVGRQFHVMVFIHQLAAHLILPLFFFLPNAYGQGLRWDDPSAVFFNIAYPLTFYAMMISWNLCSSSDQTLLGSGIYLPFTMYVTHRIIISLKYATLSPTEYKRFNECKDRHLSYNYLGQMMLFSGWLDLDPSVLYFELGAASARIGTRINEIYFLLKDEHYNESWHSQVRFWNAFLRGHDFVNFASKPCPEMQHLPSGHYAISAYDVCLAIIRRSNDYGSWKTWTYRAVNVTVLIVLVISFMPVIYYKDSFENVGAVCAYMITSTILNYAYGRTFYILLSIAIFDVKRYRHMVEILHCMIRVTDVMVNAYLTIGKTRVSTAFQQYADMRQEAIIAINEKVPWQESISISLDEAAAHHHQQPVPPLNTATLQEHHLHQHTVRPSLMDDEDGKDTIVHATRGPSQLQHHNDGYSIGSSSILGEERKEAPGIAASNVLPFLPISIHQARDGLAAPAASSNQTSSSKFPRASKVFGEKIAYDGCMAFVPRVNFEFPENILAWTYCRIAIQSFGDRFRFRTDIYIGFTLALMLIMMLIVLVEIISNQGSARHAVFQSTFFLQTIITVSLLVVFLLTVSFIGTGVNDELVLHNRTMSARGMRVKSKLIFKAYHKHASEDPVEDEEDNWDEKLLGEQKDCIGEALGVMDLNNQLRPFKFMGFTAQSALTVSIFTTVLSFYSVVFSFYSAQASAATSFLSNA